MLKRNDTVFQLNWKGCDNMFDLSNTRAVIKKIIHSLTGGINGERTNEIREMLKANTSLKALDLSGKAFRQDKSSREPFSNHNLQSMEGRDGFKETIEYNQIIFGLQGITLKTNSENH